MDLLHIIPLCQVSLILGPFFSLSLVQPSLVVFQFTLPVTTVSFLQRRPLVDVTIPACH